MAAAAVIGIFCAENCAGLKQTEGTIQIKQELDYKTSGNMKIPIPFMDDLTGQEIKPDPVAAAVKTKIPIPFMADVTKQEIKQDCFQTLNSAEFRQQNIHYTRIPEIKQEQSPHGDGTKNYASMEESEEETARVKHELRDEALNSAEFQQQNTDYIKIPVIKQEQSSPCGDEMQSCPLCSVVLSKLDVLDEHMKIVHNAKFWKHDGQQDLQELLPQDRRVNMSNIFSASSDIKFPCTESETSRKVNIKSTEAIINLRDHQDCTTDIYETLSECHRNKQNENCIKISDKVLSVGENRTNISEWNTVGRICDANKGNLQTCTRRQAGKSYKCDDCGVGFCQLGQVRSHMIIHTGEKPYKCDICSICFTRRDCLQSHKRIHTGDKPYRCDICDVRFTRKDHLQSHKRIHTEEKPFRCDICNVSFTHKNSLQRHKRIHTGEKPYRCDVCNVSFTNKNNLQNHKRVHTGDKPYKCDVCDVSFTRRSNLQKHKRIHTGEIPYRCDVSDVYFTQKYDLQYNKLIHTGEKSYRCDVCELSFTYRSKLQRHKRVHTGEKPYKCDVCHVHFTEKYYLGSHKLIHTGERPYMCDACGISFTRKGNLQRHKRIHTGGEKPHRCSVCDVLFAQKCDLQYHKRIHTGEKPYKCDVCDLSFNRRSNLQRHKGVHT